jgi:hypothetical protein
MPKTQSIPIPQDATIGDASQDAQPQTSQSTAVPIPQDATVLNEGEQINDVGNKVIVPKDGESFADTMKRAVAQGKVTTQSQLDAEAKTALGKAGEVLAATPVIAGGGVAALAAPAEVAMGIRAIPAVAEAVLDHAEAYAKAIADKYPTLVSAAGKMGVPTSVVGTLIYLYEHSKGK